MTLSLPTSDTSEIYKASLSILTTIRLKGAVRLLGIALSSLEKGAFQMSLFDNGSDRKATLMKAVDMINEKFGERSVTFASALMQEDRKVISPAWRPNGVKKSDL